MKKNKPTADLAAKWKCTPRTVRNWRAAGAPLTDNAAMRSWLAGRKNMPPGVSATPESGKRTATPETPEVSGAGGALSRLGRAELAAYRRLDEALAANDPIGIRSARDSWLKIANELRHFERSVEEHRREIGALINKSEVVRALESLGRCMMWASDGMLPHLAAELASETDVIRSRIIIRKSLYPIAIVSYGFLEAQGIPAWMVEAVSKHFVSDVTVSREEISEIATAIREQMERATANVIASEPKVSA